MKHFDANQCLDDEIGIEGWRQVMVDLAVVVTAHPKYLPLYERAEREFLLRQSGASVLDRARRLAEGVSQTMTQTMQHFPAGRLPDRR